MPSGIHCILLTYIFVMYEYVGVIAAGCMCSKEHWPSRSGEWLSCFINSSPTWNSTSHIPTRMSEIDLAGTTLDMIFTSMVIVYKGLLVTSYHKNGCN